jgi:hypothetical protein
VKKRTTKRQCAAHTRFCNKFSGVFSGHPKPSHHNGCCFWHVARGVFLIEVFVRLGLALLLSMGLALLLAWGWDSSDRAATDSQALVSAASVQEDANGLTGASLDPAH